MIPQPSPRINTVIAASYRPEERPKKKKAPSQLSPSLKGEATKLFPTRSRSVRTTASSLSSQSTSSHEFPLHEHLIVSSITKQEQIHDPRGNRAPSVPSPSPSPAAAARTARPSFASSTSSATPSSIPASSRESRESRESSQLNELEHDNDRDEDLHPHVRHDRDDHHQQRPAYHPRDSVASIKDDPFFRHYQTPQSVSQGRELMAATYEHSDEDAELVSPLSPRPRSMKKPPVDEGVNIPVSSRRFPVVLDPRKAQAVRDRMLT